MKKSGSPRLDPEASLKLAAELAEACHQLRDAYLESNRQELLERFNRCLAPGANFKPDPDAVLLGFREAWRRRDYRAIKSVGDRLGPGFFTHQREAEAYFFAAKSRVGREAGPNQSADSGAG